MSARTPRRGGKGGAEPRGRIRLREAQVLELAHQGHRQRQIAATLGISQAAVSKILTRVDERALRDLTAAVARQKAAQTRVLDHLQAEALQAWEHSKAETTRRRQRQSRAGDRVPGTSVELTVETRHGDPRYLEVVLRTLSD